MLSLCNWWNSNSVLQFVIITFIDGVNVSLLSYNRKFLVRLSQLSSQSSHKSLELALSRECNQRCVIQITEVWSRTWLVCQFGLDINVCHFSVGSLCCWNPQDVFCVGFSFQASGLISRSGISSSSTVCYCKTAVALSAARVCYSASLMCCVCVFVCVLAHICLCGTIVRCMFVCGRSAWICVRLCVEFNGVVCCLSCCVFSAGRWVAGLSC